MLTLKEFLGGLAALMCFIQYGPLIWKTFKGTKTPHVMTRVIWAFTFSIGSATQYAGHGGAGSWANGLSAVACVIIAIAALKRDKSYVTRSDWITFFSVLFVIPIWLLSRDPLYAALWGTAIDLAAYIPTFRKSWGRPHDELVSSFFAGTIKQALALTAMETYSLTTVVFPSAILTANLTVIAVLVMRRRLMLAQTEAT